MALVKLILLLVLGLFAGAIAGCNDRSGPVPAPGVAASEADTAGRRGDSAAGQWFTEVTSAVGIDFVHETGGTGDFLMPEIMGAGVALFDFDQDGDLDLYLITANRTLPNPGPADSPVNRLYRQEADGRFTDVTTESGLGDGGYGMGVAIGDIDNDGDRDVYITNYGPDRLYRNRGDGTFQDITEAAGIDVPGWSCSAAFLDYDRDGYLDLYITQYVNYDSGKRCSNAAGRRDYCGPKEFLPVADVLLHNNGDPAAPGFTDVSGQTGIASEAAAGLGVVIDDFNNDGWIDVYVANDAYANHLWINQTDGTFQELAIIYGAAYNLHGQAEAGMGVVSADFDGDVDPDIFVTHLNKESNTMYRQLEAGAGFEDVTGVSGLAGSSMDLTGFGVAAFDLELDGDLDLFIANGKVVRGDPRPGATLRPPWNWFAEPNLLYTNDGTGRFTLVGEPARSLCAPIEISRGAAMGDIDLDGDIDVVLTNAQGPARIYLNHVDRNGTWLIVRAWDEALNRDAIGARIYVGCRSRTFMRTISGAAGYLSANEAYAHFGLGDSEQFDSIEVHWPDGSRERFPGGAANRSVTLVRGGGEPLS